VVAATELSAWTNKLARIAVVKNVDLDIVGERKEYESDFAAVVMAEDVFSSLVSKSLSVG
jgi:hypothetical protein